MPYVSGAAAPVFYYLGEVTQMKLDSNQVTGFETNSSTTGAWWIMADGSKHSGAPRDKLLLLIQTEYNTRATIHIKDALKYVFSNFKKSLYMAISVYVTEKTRALDRLTNKLSSKAR